MEADDGPQAARSRRLAAQTARVFPPSLQAKGPEPQLQLHAHEQQQTRLTLTLQSGECAPTAECHIEIARLRDEKEFLTKYAERLLVQLRVELQRRGELDRLKAITDPAVAASEGPTDEAGGDKGTERRLPPWMVAREVVHPLLQAYDVKIQELEVAVSDAKQAMDRMARHAEALAQANTTLRQELEATTEKMMLRLQHDSKESSHMSMPMDELGHESGEYLGDLNERIDVLMSENSMLMEQVSLQDDELNGLRKELADRDQQLVIMGQNFNQATLAVQELRDAYASVGEEKSRCEQRLQQYVARVAQLEGDKEAMSKQADALKAEARALETQIHEYDILMENLKQTAERKEENFTNRYQNVSSRIRELASAVEERDKRVEELEEQNRLLTSELECVRQDCEGMLQVMNNMEKQLTQYCSREDAVAELESECKAKMEEVLIEKEQISAREAQGRREIARLLEKLRTVSEEHRKAHEDARMELTRRTESEVRSREGEIRELNMELAQVRAKLDISVRTQRDTETLLADAVRRAKGAADTYEKKLKGLVERATTAEEAKDTAIRAENDAIVTLRAKEEELSKIRNDFRDRMHDLNERISSLERELDMRRNEVRELRDESEEKSHKIRLLNEQLNKVKADCADRYSNEFEAVHRENRELKSRAADFEYKLSVSQKELASAVEAARIEKERSEVRLIAELETIKARLGHVKEEKSRTEKSRQEADARISVLSLQLQQMSRELGDTKEALIEREHACDDSDRKVAELSAQLTIALSKQQQFLRVEREMRASVERATLEKARLEREATNCRKKLEEYRQTDFAGLSNLYGRPDRLSFSKVSVRKEQRSNQTMTTHEHLN